METDTKRPEVATVLFVDRTRDGELAASLREEEKTHTKLSKYKVKVVERAGERLERILVKTDPFEGRNCGREDCVLCRNTGNRKPCNRRNLVYRATCNFCEEKREREKEQAVERGEENYFPTTRKAEYWGETGRSIYRRGREHEDLYRRIEESSFMMKHFVSCHLGEGKRKRKKT